MDFLNDAALNAAIKQRVENARKIAMRSGATPPIRLDDLTMQVVAKGDVTLASNMSNQVQDTPIKLWTSKQTPLLNLIGVGRPITVDAATRKVSIKVINQLSRRSKRGYYAEEGKRVGSTPLSAVDGDFVFATRGTEAGASDESTASGGKMGDPLAMGIKIAMPELLEINEFAALCGAGTGSGIGTTPTPTVVPAESGGSLTSGAYGVYCIAMSAAAVAEYRAAKSLALPTTYLRPNKDGSTTTVYSGLGRKSAAQSATVGTGDAGVLTCSVASVRGAFGYAWFAGLSGAVRLCAVTTIPSVVIKTAAVETAQNITEFPTADESFDPLASDGILAQILRTDSGSYVKNLNGASLTRSVAGNSVKEIDDVLSYLYEEHRVTPQVPVMSPKTFLAVAALIRPESLLQPLYAGISMIYPNNIGSGIDMNMVISFDIPDGCIYFHSTSVPMASDVGGTTIELRTIIPANVKNWAKVTRADEVGIYQRDTLVCCITPAFSLLTGIKLD